MSTAGARQRAVGKWLVVLVTIGLTWAIATFTKTLHLPSFTFYLYLTTHVATIGGWFLILTHRPDILLNPGSGIRYLKMVVVTLLLTALSVPILMDELRIANVG